MPCLPFPFFSSPTVFLTFPHPLHEEFADGRPPTGRSFPVALQEFFPFFTPERTQLPLTRLSPLLFFFDKFRRFCFFILGTPFT